jgi:hypothetical protein
MFKEELHQVLESRRGITRGSPRSMQKKKTHMRLEKAQSNGGSQERMLDLRKSCAEVPNIIRIPIFFTKNFGQKRPILDKSF